MRHLSILLAVTIFSLGCSDSKGGGKTTGDTGGVDPNSLPAITTTRTGIFLDAGTQLVIEFSTYACDPNCPAGATTNAAMSNDGIQVQLSDSDFNDLAITMIEVRADGVDVPMTLSNNSYVSDFPDAQPVFGKYEFTIESGAGNSISGLIYDPKFMVPHSILAPAAETALKVGQDVEVKWAPNDPRLLFQVDMSNQPYDAKYAAEDPGVYLLPGSVITTVQDSDYLRVGRRVIQGIEGLKYSGIRHTHHVEIPVSVVAP
jgi:hypothetical protein